MRVKCEKCVNCRAITQEGRKKRIHCGCEGFKDSSVLFGYKSIERPLLCSFYEEMKKEKK